MKDTVYKFVIQDKKTGAYLSHDGSNGVEHPYEDVNDVNDATIWQTLEHVTYVLWWYVDMFRDFRIIDLNTGKRYVKDKERGISHVKGEDERE